MTTAPAPTHSLAEALAMEVDGDTAHAHVHQGWDVFGIPHGGYLAALAARAVLEVSGQPDVFTQTTHFVRKARFDDITIVVTPLGASRRFASWQAVATQDDEVVVVSLASVGDRTAIEGPDWSDVAPWDPDGEALSPPAGHPDLPFTAPQVAERFGQRIAVSTAGFATGQRQDRAVLRAVVHPDQVDQLAAIVACDITPPAIWNPLGTAGWVPTLELTVHLRGRPAAGPMSIDVVTHHVQDGFLEEDAVVRDADGRLVAQSRQLARWTAT